MEVRNLGDKFWAGWIRTKEEEFIKEEDFKNLVAIKDFKALIDFVSKYYKGITQENWRNYFLTFVEIMEEIIRKRFDEKILEVLKNENWDFLFEIFKKNEFLKEIFSSLKEFKKNDKKDFGYERSVVEFIRRRYKDVFSKIEGDEIFIMFYLYKIYEIKILWSIFETIERGFDLKAFKEEVCLI